MPEEAFLSPEEAVRAFGNGKRQVLVLSYGWLSANAPDPRGERLALIRRFLATLPDAAECGFFMDHVCLPQLPRTPEEDKVFYRGLKSMGKLYASVTGTAVVQIKAVPTRPAEMDGALVIRKLAEAVDEEQLKTALSTHGEVLRCELQRGATGSAEVQYATHAQAENAVKAGMAALRLSSSAGRHISRELSRRMPLTDRAPTMVVLLEHAVIFEAYNSRPYEERGWCCFEEGVAQVVVAHLAEQAREGRLTPKHITAGKIRPKLLAIDESGAVEPHEAKLAPNKLVADLQERINNDAKFTGEEDRTIVEKLLIEFVWMVSRGVEQAVEQQMAKTAGPRSWGQKTHPDPLPPSVVEAGNPAPDEEQKHGASSLEITNLDA